MPSPRDPEVARLASAVLMPGFTGARLPAWLARAAENGLGGVCLFAPNVSADVATLTGALHGIRDGLLVASDEEGGEVTRLESATGSSWPGHAALGRFDDPEATRRIAAALGGQSRSAGVDLVLAPDVDVTSNPDNPVIGLRAFGTDPERVSRHAAAFVEGLQSAGVAGCAKHFPGHGDTRTDSHVGLPVIDVDVATLRRRDLPPFAAAVAAGVRAVMTAHVVFPALDDSPATLSATVLDLLRRDLGFDGVIVSDALDMKAISGGVGRGPGAALALAAGVDLVCIGNPNHPTVYDDEAAFHEVHDAVIDAVVAGRLPMARLEEAARRISELSAWLTVSRAGAVAEAGAHDPAAHELAAHVATSVIETHGEVALGPGTVTVLDLRGTPNMAAGPRPSGVLAALRDQAAGVTVHDLLEGSETKLVEILRSSAASPLVVITGSPHRSPDRQRLLDEVVSARPDVVVVATGLPDERDRLGEHWIRTWGDSRPAGAAAADLLLG